MDRRRDMRQIGVAKEVAVQSHPALHVGDGNIVQLALQRQVSGDRMGAKVAFAHPDVDPAGDDYPL